ncbi:MAG: shikimate dehydrogenase [Clostridia bacterium]|nr:shikimate dehydrogenase [Clostridia bacterium]
MSISTLKGRYYVTGKSLPHTMSPDIYTRLGLNYGVKEFKTEEDFIAYVNSRDYDGINVTIPYKQTVMPCLDYISDEAAEIGAVNTVVNKCGKLYGYNTDCYGMQRAMTEYGISVQDKKVVILGSGGTAKCAVYVSKKLGAKEVKICSRSGEYQYADLYRDNDVEVIINTTPIGMFPSIDSKVIDLKKLTSVQAVYDVIYNPLTTALVSEARSLGLKAGNGLSMLVYQGIKAYELYTDTICSDKVAQTILNQIYNDKRNVVLIGMPGCGKSTVGKAVALKLNKEFIDVDDEFTNTFGLTPSEAILTKGEEVFRDMEAEVVKALSAKLGIVIATGGGSVLRAENRKALKANGAIVFIDRDLNLLSSDGRPLSQQKGVEALYGEREPIYRTVADFTIATDKTTTIEDVAQIIVDLM